MLALERPALTFLLNAAWMITVIAMAAFVWERAPRRSAPRLREIAFAAGLTLCAILPAATLFLPAVPSADAALFVVDATVVAVPAMSDNARWTKYVFLAYVLFLMVSSVRLLRDYLRLGRLNEDNIRVPLTFGVIHQRILLPRYFREAASAPAIEAALAHEEAHARQLDFASNLLFEVLTLPVSFHPGVAYFKRRLAQACELVCDEQAACALGDRRRYAQGLLAAAEFLAQPETPSRLALGMLDHQHFEERIMTLSEPAAPFSKTALCRLATLLILAPTLTLFAVRLRADDQIYKVGGDVSAPRIVHKEEPAYSAAARDAKVEGTVVLSLAITEGGIAESIKVVRGLHEDLDRNAMAAVERWRFEPAKRQDQPVKVTATVEVNFRLM